MEKKKEVLCKVDSISKSYGKRDILKNISFSLYKGEIVGIVGKSGAGKSTLMNIIAGIASKNRGTITFSKEEVGMEKLKSLIGYSFQPYSLYEELTLKENLYYFGRLYGLSDSEIMARANELFGMTDLSIEDFDTRVSSLSGGMKKRFDIVCSLLHSPKILLLDEPTAGLDPLRRKDIIRIMKKISSDGVTVVISSHIMSDIDGICDRVLILHDGKELIMDSPENIKDEILENEMIRLRTLPGRYDNIIKILAAFNILHCETNGEWLIIYTPESEVLIHFILHLLKSEGETIDKMTVTEPDLGDVFEKLSSKGEPRIMKEQIEKVKGFVYELIGKRYSEKDIKNIMLSHKWPEEIAEALIEKEMALKKDKQSIKIGNSGVNLR